MAYLLHRITHGAPYSDMLFGKGYLTIGYYDVTIEAHKRGADLVALAQSCRNQDDYSDTNPDYMEFRSICETGVFWSDNASHLKNLRNFFTLQPEDVVLVPLDGGMFGIYIVDKIPFTNYDLDQELKDAILSLHSNLFVKEDGVWARKPTGSVEWIDFSGFVKVHPISRQGAELPRDVVSDNLRKRLSYRQTNISCSDFADEIDDLIDTYI